MQERTGKRGLKMTTLNEAKEAIYERFVALYTGVPLNRITFDNEEFEAGDGNDPWVRVSVRGLSREQESLGRKTNRRFRSFASTFVQVYTEANTGVQISDNLATEAGNVFEGESFSGLDFLSAVIQETGPDGKWYQNLVEVEFSYDEIK